MPNLSGQGMVLAPGTFDPPASLTPGTHTITIESAAGENEGLVNDAGNLAVSEYLNVRCVYPDGYTKGHQVKTPQDIAARAMVVLRSHYGVTGEIKITKLPASLTAGETLVVEV